MLASLATFDELRGEPEDATHEEFKAPKAESEGLVVSDSLNSPESLPD